jgi:hypothetical protein
MKFFYLLVIIDCFQLVANLTHLSFVEKLKLAHESAKELAYRMAEV